jgi:hypothetical protein
MGAGFSAAQLPRCPTPFEGVGNMACVMVCPTEKGYERRLAGGEYQCVYKSDPQYAVVMNTVSATVFFPGSTLEDLKAVNPTAYSDFDKERTRFANELIITDEKISKSLKLKNAFQRLMEAENVRDKAPGAYQQARTNYYTLKEGDTWKERERERILKADVEPIAKRFMEVKTKTFQQYENQRKTVDVVNGLKDTVLSMKDEMKYAATTFQDQLNKVKDAVNREHRGRDSVTEVNIWDWVDFILNGVIVISLMYVIYLLYKKFVARPPSSAAPAVVIRR